MSQTSATTTWWAPSRPGRATTRQPLWIICPERLRCVTRPCAVPPQPSWHPYHLNPQHPAKRANAWAVARILGNEDVITKLRGAP